MDVADVAIALGGERGGGRLPFDVCVRIARMTRPILWRACDGCDAALLRLQVRIPFVARLPTQWRYDERGWLLTDRGAVRCTPPLERGYAASSDLSLEGKCGTCTPTFRPCTLSVGKAVFRNRVVQLDQCEWYKVVDNRFLCRACLLSVYRMRVSFYAWARSAR